MSTPQIIVTFDGRRSRQYLPGETLAGSYRFDSMGSETIQAVEVSVLWFTEGKGTEDFGMHDHWRRSADAGDWIDPRHPGRFSAKLPRSPLSYHGIIVKVHWCVRVRVILDNGREITEELPFTLGNLPDVRTLKT